MCLRWAITYFCGAYAWLFLAIWNWGGMDQCLEDVNMRNVQINIKI